MEDKFIKAFVNANPENYLTYWILGDYYKKNTEFVQAAHNYELALSKEVASQKEASQIKASLSELGKR